LPISSQDGARISKQRNFAAIAAAALLVIVYGSLFPFQFHERSGNPVYALLATWNQHGSRGDLISNVLLYLPLGFFAAGSLLSLPSLARVLVVTAGGMGLSAGMELVQFYDLGRQSAMSDLYANTAGSFLGAVAGSLLGSELSFRNSAKLRQRPFVVLLLACWLGYRLFPYVPVIDLHKYWHAMQHVFEGGGISLVDCYRHTAIWLAIAMLLRELTGRAWNRVAVWAAVAAVTLARTFIIGIVLSRAEIVGGLLAAALWSLVLVHSSRQAPIIAAVFAAGTVLQGLAPFRFSSTPHALVWIPFAGFLSGSIELNLLSFFEKVFLYGALVWLAARAGVRWRVAMLLGSGLVFCIRLCQAYLPDRSADMTDVMLLLLVSVTAELLSEGPGGTRATNPAGPAGWIDRTLPRIRALLTVSDEVKPVDLILVLAGRMERKAYGLQLYGAGIAPRLVLSVGRFEVSKMRGLEPDVHAELAALRDGTPADERHFLVVLGQTGGRVEKLRLSRCSTYGEALGLRAFLEKQNVRRVMVISTSIHLRRAALAFSKVYQDAGLEFLFCPVPPRLEARMPDYRYVVQEIFKLAAYGLILRLPRRAANILMRLR
jgi:VanZ family protein/uncharacterized SAM-binding protein YcdF (DUF218 family)